MHKWKQPASLGLHAEIEHYCAQWKSALSSKHRFSWRQKQGYLELGELTSS